MSSKILVLETIRSFKDEFSEKPLGRTALQKFCYFEKKLGVPFQEFFHMHFYGPYSERLAEKISGLEIDGFIQDNSSGPGRSVFELTDLGKEFLIQHSEKLDSKHEKIIEAVTKAFGRLNTNQLELLSSVYFIWARKKQENKTADPVRDAVVQEVGKIKRDKFSKEEISETYDAMKSVSLIDAN